MRTFLLGIRPGDIRTGTVADVRDFGVFVNLDGEPGGTCTGFIRIPELSWSHFDRAADVVEAGQRVTAAVLDVDPRREQVALSLKALREDPLIRFAGRVGEVVAGRVTKVVPFGVFVRVAPGIEGLLRTGDRPDLGDEITVRITEVDRQHRRVKLDLT